MNYQDVWRFYFPDSYQILLNCKEMASVETYTERMEMGFTSTQKGWSWGLQVSIYFMQFACGPQKRFLCMY